MLKSGRYINNNKLVEKLVKSSYQELKKLKNQNINFVNNDDNNFRLFQASGHTYPRTVRCLGGNTKQYYSSIRAKALKKGIEIINNVEVFRLIKKEGKICGAIGIKNNKQIFISCPSVILATGGFSSNYNFSTHNRTIQGLGHTMALHAGAKLTDMEFIQFMPTVIAYPENLKGVIVTDTLRGEGATLLNKNGKRFMKNYSPVKREMETRDEISRSILQEISENNGTKNKAVYLDARHIDRGIIKSSFTNYNLLMKSGIDPKKSLIEVFPAAHYTCGGIKIDVNAFTGVNGLWAAGEVTGGVHGSNRLGSTALIENIIFGKAAGENAALYSLNSQNCCKYNKLRYEKKIKQNESIILRDIESKLRTILSKNVGLIRNKTSLISGMEEIENITDRINKLEDESVYNLKLIELQSFALINYCIIKSCIMRRESRGTHFREDYPKEKETLAKTINIYQKNDKIFNCYEK